MKCEICGKEVASFTHVKIDDEINIVCVGCRDKMEVMADYEYERQKEEAPYYMEDR